MTTGGALGFARQHLSREKDHQTEYPYCVRIIRPGRRAGNITNCYLP
jgi:hypothetical protein